MSAVPCHLDDARGRKDMLPAGDKAGPPSGTARPMVFALAAVAAHQSARGRMLQRRHPMCHHADDALGVDRQLQRLSDVGHQHAQARVWGGIVGERTMNTTV